MKQYIWLPWMTRNRNQDWTRGPLFASWDQVIRGVQVREQADFGVVDMAVASDGLMGPADDADWLPWMTGNGEHDWERAPFEAPDGTVLAGLEVREQGGYGIVDVRCVVRSLADGTELSGPWFCGNPNGQVIRSVCERPDFAVVGIEVREQAGFGLIDIRLACADASRIFPARREWVAERPALK